MIKVDYGIPMPESRANFRGYPWRLMDVGGSFKVETPDGKVNQKIQRSLSCQACQAGKRHGVKFLTRWMPDEHCYRIFRVA